MTTTLCNNTRVTNSALNIEKSPHITNINNDCRSLDKANLDIAMELLNNSDFKEGNMILAIPPDIFHNNDKQKVLTKLNQEMRISS